MKFEIDQEVFVISHSEVPGKIIAIYKDLKEVKEFFNPKLLENIQETELDNRFYVVKYEDKKIVVVNEKRLIHKQKIYLINQAEGREFVIVLAASEEEAETFGKSIYKEKITIDEVKTNESPSVIYRDYGDY